jgi:hypothetical protein
MGVVVLRPSAYHRQIFLGQGRRPTRVIVLPSSAFHGLCTLPHVEAGLDALITDAASVATTSRDLVIVEPYLKDHGVPSRLHTSWAISFAEQWEFKLARKGSSQLRVCLVRENFWLWLL